jgi:hypothetical protein
MTNWMGDQGFLRRLNVEVRRPVLLGDTLWWKGAVTGKEVVDGYHSVHIEVLGITQREEKVSWGTAEVYLPSREHGPVVLPVPAAA